MIDTSNFRKVERERAAEEAKRKHEAYMKQQSELMAKQIEKQKRKRRKIEEKKIAAKKSKKERKKKKDMNESEKKEIENLEDECKQVCLVFSDIQF